MNKLVCVECGRDFELFQNEREILCRDHFEKYEELRDAINFHLLKKDTLNDKLNFLTRFQIWIKGGEAFHICEEIREQLVREEIQKKWENGLRNNKNSCRKKKSIENS